MAAKAILCAQCVARVALPAAVNQKDIGRRLFQSPLSSLKMTTRSPKGGPLRI